MHCVGHSCTQYQWLLPPYRMVVPPKDVTEQREQLPNWEMDRRGRHGLSPFFPFFFLGASVGAAGVALPCVCTPT